MAINKENENTDNIFVGFLKTEVNDFLQPRFWRAVAAECLGMVILVAFGVSANLYPEGGTPSSSVHAALEAGFYIGCIICILQNVSGGHCNPTITTGFASVRQITVIRFIFYLIFQTLGGIAGAAIVRVITPESMHHNFAVIKPGVDVQDWQALICEFMICFFMNFGTMAVIDPGRSDLPGSMPLMIGLMVAINVLVGWNISGGCMNPVRNFAPAVVSGDLDKQWLYWVGDLAGGACGSLTYDKLFSTSSCACLKNRNTYDVTTREDNDIKLEDKGHVNSVAVEG